MGAPSQQTALPHARDTYDLTSLSAYIEKAMPLLFQSGEYTGTITGTSGDPTITVQYKRVGDIVAVRVLAATNTSDANTYTITGAPTAIRPNQVQGDITMPSFTDNSVVETSGNVLAQMTSDGEIRFLRNGSLTGFTAAGSKGHGSFTMVYLLGL